MFFAVELEKKTRRRENIEISTNDTNSSINGS
jgi:hypothetical protein